MAEFLSAHGQAADFYHAGMAKSQRQIVQSGWQRGDIRIVVATVAFGMGVDKPDTRWVAHATMPKSLEGAFQEAGRAGRDGRPAHCVIFYHPGDVARIRRLLMMDGNGRQRGNAKSQALLQSSLAKVGAMQRYCEATVAASAAAATGAGKAAGKGGPVLPGPVASIVAAAETPVTCRRAAFVRYLADGNEAAAATASGAASFVPESQRLRCNGTCDLCWERLNPAAAFAFAAGSGSGSSSAAVPSKATGSATASTRGAVSVAPLAVRTTASAGSAAFSWPAADAAAAARMAVAAAASRAGAAGAAAASSSVKPLIEPGVTVPLSWLSGRDHTTGASMGELLAELRREFDESGALPAGEADHVYGAGGSSASGAAAGGGAAAAAVPLGMRGGIASLGPAASAAAGNASGFRSAATLGAAAGATGTAARSAAPGPLAAHVDGADSDSSAEVIDLLDDDDDDDADADARVGAIAAAASTVVVGLKRKAPDSSLGTASRSAHRPVSIGGVRATAADADADLPAFADEAPFGGAGYTSLAALQRPASAGPPSTSAAAGAGPGAWGSLVSSSSSSSSSAAASSRRPDFSTMALLGLGGGVSSSATGGAGGGLSAWSTARGSSSGTGAGTTPGYEAGGFSSILGMSKGPGLMSVLQGRGKGSGSKGRSRRSSGAGAGAGGITFSGGGGTGAAGAGGGADGGGYSFGSDAERRRYFAMKKGRKGGRGRSRRGGSSGGFRRSRSRGGSTGR